MKEIKNGATYLLALSLFSLAGALIYFTVQLSNISVTVSKELPNALTSITQASDKIEPVIKEISGIRELVPPILNEISEARKHIPAVLEEVRQVREQIPAILEEVRQTRPLVPIVLDEVAKTRQAIPPMLERGEKLIAQARKAGTEASKGAVTGLLKGVITAPFTIIGGVGKQIFGLGDEALKDLSEDDIKQMEQQTKEILLAEKVGAYREWNNKASGYSGKLILMSIDTMDDRHCKSIKIQLLKEGKQKVDKITILCRNDEGIWEKN